MGTVDRQLVEVRAAQPGQLGVEVGEIARLQKRIVGEVDPTGHVGRAEGDLLGLGEVVGRIAIERQPADDLDGRQLLGHQLGRVEEVDPLERLVLGVGKDLDAEIPLGECARFYGVPEVAAVKVGIDPTELLGLLPHERGQTGNGLPMELDECRLAPGGDESEGMDAEPFHRPVGPWDAPVRHGPHEHVGRFGGQ